MRPASCRARSCANRQLEFLCADVTVTVESSRTVFTDGLRPGDELVIPIKHGEGNWVADESLHAELVERGQIVLRYDEDVNGSLDRVAGVANEEGNVLGLMPHPEHAVDPLLGPTGGIPLLEGLIAAAHAHVAGRARRRRPIADSGEKGRQAGAICRAPTVARVDAAPHGHATRLASSARRSSGARSRAAPSFARSRSRSVTGPRRDAPSVA